MKLDMSLSLSGVCGSNGMTLADQRIADAAVALPVPSLLKAGARTVVIFYAVALQLNFHRRLADRCTKKPSIAFKLD